MALQLIDSHDLIRVENVVVHLFGDPGVFKTTLANTGNKVLLVDFDKGAHRSLGRQRVIRLDSWGDLEELLQHAWFLEAEELVIDTVGRSLDLLSDAIISGDSKKGNPLSGLNQQGWGALKQRFGIFFRKVKDAKKNVVLLSHAKLDKDKDGNKTAYPDIPGGSAGEVFKVSDAIGYCFMQGGRRIIDFNITDGHIGKNPPGWGPITFPDFAPSTSRFLAERILNPLKEHLNSLSEEQAAVLALVADWQAKIEETEPTAEVLTALLGPTGAIEHPAAKSQVQTLLWRKAKDNGIDFDKATRAFVPKPKGEKADEPKRKKSA